eukprot:TRINITY_DN8233_c0_g2_i3.p1 TRINITY_DN8233_c0_g2~~TRINITY_DN8233_c0_g2_i3.p1  ORF type:complete len:513 (-),score=100.37 TRINITY_DN8233_c0_g2_i3:26-1564(-)
MSLHGHLVGWQYLPELVLLKIFSQCDLSDISAVAQVCARWNQFAQSNSLWRNLFLRRFRVKGAANLRLRPGSSNWREEFRRLYCKVPIVCTDTLTFHTDEVLHVAFSHKGDKFSTCSKDANFVVWRVSDSYQPSMEFRVNMRRFGWLYTWSSKFNSTDSLLLVSGVCSEFNGEIAVYRIVNGNKYEILVKVASNPYDVMGDWVSECHFLTGRIQSDMYGNSGVISICKADPSMTPDIFQPVETPAVKNVVLTLLFDNHNAFFLRHILATDRSIFGPDASIQNSSRHSIENCAARLSQVPDQECRDILDEKEICIIFLTNSETLAPHKLGFCKLGPDNTDYIYYMRHPDKVIEMNGHIIGMDVSKDSRYLYVNVRSWPENCVLSYDTSPVIAQQIEMRVVDLKTLTLLDKVYSGHKGFTSSFDAFYIYIDQAEDYVCSGSEDMAARIWDKYYGCVAAELKHTRCVSACAFSPRNHEFAVTVSDDFTIKVWKSRDLNRECEKLEKSVKKRGWFG